MNDGKPQDFLTVDSFSQLPFIRRPPQMPPPPPPPPPNPPNIRLFGFNFSSTDTDHPPAAAAAASSAGKKFECHYCCRNFPTSQALGGHQNAHKLERQKAKRAHMLGLTGSRRFGSAVATSRLPFSHPAALFYTPWNTAAAPPSGFGSATQPITGSPLTEIWRIPPPSPEAAVAAAAGGEVGYLSADSSSSSSSSPRKKSVYNKDGVSLDLNL